MYKIYITYPSVDRYKWLFSFPGTMSKKGIVYNVAHQLRSKNSLRIWTKTSNKLEGWIEERRR